MHSYLLFLAILMPIVFSVVIRFLNISNRQKENANLILVTLTAILVLILVIIPPTDNFVLFKFNEKLVISFKLDGIGRVFAGLIAILWPFAYLYVTGYMENADPKMNYSMFYVMTFGVVLGISFASNIISLYFFYEMLTLVTIPLIIFPMTKEAKRATRLYLYISLFGSTLALVGIFILTTSFDISTFDSLLKSIANSNGRHGLIYTSFMLMFLGFSVKAAMFPFHVWLPGAGVAPTPTTALLHAVAVVKAGAFAIIRVIYSCIGHQFLSGSVVQIIAIIMTSITIVFGSVMALKQAHMKRRFAYSTIANISYILLAACLMNEYSLYAAMLHLIYHSFAKIAVFFITGELMHEANAIFIDQLDGLGKKMPVSFICFILSGFSIAGIPMFSGFVSKFEIAIAAIQVNTWYSFVGIIALLISALFTAVYIFTIIIRAFFKKPNEYNITNYNKAHEGNYKFLVPIVTLSFLSLLFGVIGSPLTNLIASLLKGVGL